MGGTTFISGDRFAACDEPFAISYYLSVVLVVASTLRVQQGWVGNSAVVGEGVGHRLTLAILVNVRSEVVE